VTTYRDATLADAEAVRAVYLESFDDTFGHLYATDDYATFLATQDLPRWQAQLTDPAYAVYLAERDGAVAGFAKLTPVSLPIDPTDRPGIELSQLYVLPRHKGQGIAPVLMDWVMAEARRRGAADIYLSVWTENHRARRFYARYGFIEVKPYHFMVGNHADEDILCRVALDG
jgi:GNAT superfamily N-acetyltransferase